MVSKKSASKHKTLAPSNLSSKLSAGGVTSSALKLSAFSPPSLRLSLFASVVLGLDAYRLRIHDTNTGRLRCEHILEKGITINSLAWGSLPSKDKKGAKKKRKRIANGEDPEDAKYAVVAAATNRGTVLLFSPSEAAVVGVLEGEHIGAVKHFVFAKEEGRGWSCGVDGKLVEWDIAKKVSISTTALPENSVRRITPSDLKVLCAASTIYAIDKANPGMSEPPTFTANTTFIHTLIASQDGNRFLSAAESDRFINIFSLKENKHIGALVAESDVLNVSVFQGSNAEVLATVTADGVVEVFGYPFDTSASAAESPSASRKKKSSTKNSEAKVKVIRPGRKQTVAIADVSVDSEEILLAWTETGVNVEFEKVRWANSEDSSIVLSGLVEITRAKTVGLGGANGVGTVNGVKDVENMAVDQSHTIVIAGDNMQDVGMEDAPDDREIPDSTAEESDSSAAEDSEDGASDAPAQEPSFADRFRALEVSSQPTTELSTLPTKRTALNTPSAGALTSVLTQALKTNDSGLLESCLNVANPTFIRTTIRKLPSPMAVTLLERLSERLARKPGRAGSLGEWVRWTLVAHGGYLVTLPNLMRTLSGLHCTLNTRAAALPRLMALQGRLDMLQSQVELRTEMRAAMAPRKPVDRDAAVYIEGETEDVESSDEEPEEVGLEGMMIEDASFIKSPANNHDDDASSEDDERGSSAEEGFLDTDEEEEEEGDDGLESDEREMEEEGFLDLEAEEATEEEDEDEDEDEADQVDYDDVEGSDEEDVVVMPIKKGKGRR